MSSTLPFERVVDALGRRGERDLGEQVIELDSVVGSVDRDTGFDRLFRPASEEAGRGWAGARPGGPVPPIDVYRIGDVHFVVDGHRRVAAGRALGRTRSTRT